ncbi:unnamed protein product, partial [Laminaria digitata]
MSKPRKSPDELRSHRWFGGVSMRAFSDRGRWRQLGFAPEDY